MRSRFLWAIPALLVIVCATVFVARYGEPMLFSSVFGPRLEEDGLYYTVVGGNHRHIEYLLQQKFDPNTVGKEGEAPLFGVLAREYSDSEVPEKFSYNSAKAVKNLRLLLKYGVNLNVKNKEGVPFLTLAVKRKDIGLVTLLVENHVDLNAVDALGRKAADYASGEEMRQLLTKF